MKVIVIGLGIQGKKRLEIAGKDCVATIDPYQSGAMYRDVSEVPLGHYDAALVCTPDESKQELLEYLLKNKKHVLVEKPLIGGDLQGLKNLALENNVTCYTAYNHRFEPHFVRMKEVLQSGKLGKIYSCRLFYGNGTARDVRNSPWRDKNLGVLTDLGSHLLDTTLFWFGNINYDFKVISSHSFENKSPDHVVIVSDTMPLINLEMTLLSWRNHFTCDVFAENGSLHTESLCKWGPSKFTERFRKLPSGRPDEESVTLVKSDPTWSAEYRYFLDLCRKKESNIDNDIFISSVFEDLEASLLQETIS